LRSKDYINDKLPLVINVCNFQKVENSPVLLTMWDTETLFHEFWHALHEMLSESKYSELSWFNVEWDFVELPSQLHENWVWEKESLKKLAKHYKTWESLSTEILDNLEKLKTYMSWNFVTRQNEFALLDMYLYSEEVPKNVEELDKKAINLVNKYWIFKRDDDYKMYASFNHIFGWGYAAGYYSYMWAEIIEKDIWEEIKKHWIFNTKITKKFLDTILSQWTRKKASELFEDFMGRGVDSEAFMKNKWLI
jgi:peptidyl-dipeptidase Dcp